MYIPIDLFSWAYFSPYIHNQPAEEHQILFFESHFTELKIGVAPNNTQLSWCVSGTPQWSTPWDANTWYNFAYDIDVSDT